MTNEAENLNFHLSAGQDQPIKSGNFRKITLKNVFDAIDEKVLTESIREKLKNKARNYPHQALRIFLLSLDRHIAQESKNIKPTVEQKELEFPE